MHKMTYTLAEAAKLLQCHTETLRRAIMDGSLQAARLGKGYRISRMELQKFWISRGGGELFEASELAAAEAEELMPAPVKKETKPKGPHQLTLPLG